MEITVRHYLHFEPDPGTSAGLARIEHLLTHLLNRTEHMANELDALSAQVTDNTSTIESAIVLINGIADRITAAGVDKAKLAALVSDLKSEDTKLAEAVLAGTPAATTPTGTPPTGTPPAAPVFNAADATPNGSPMADGTTMRNSPGADPANPLPGFNPAAPITA